MSRGFLVEPWPPKPEHRTLIQQMDAILAGERQVAVHPDTYAELASDLAEVGRTLEGLDIVQREAVRPGIVAATWRLRK